MPELATCPECRRTLRVPDTLLGRHVKCPRCGTVFTARAEDAGGPPPSPGAEQGYQPPPAPTTVPRGEYQGERPAGTHPGSPVHYGAAVLAAEKTNVPGILLIVVGIANLLGGLYLVGDGLYTLLDPSRPQKMAQTREVLVKLEGEKTVQESEAAGGDLNKLLNVAAGILIGNGVLAMLLAIPTIAGGVRMRQLRSHGLAVVGAVLAALPCLSPVACFALGVVVGIWALVVLLNPDVKEAFRLTTAGDHPADDTA